jgi:hypothetical protein
MADAEVARGHLRAALDALGVSASESVGESGRLDFTLAWDDRRVPLAVTTASQVTAARARELVEATADGGALVVADRITADARALLNAAGWSWLDLRGHLHLRGGGLLIDSAVEAATTSMTHRSRSHLRGKAGLAVAYWLCAHPGEALSPTGQSADLGFAPSTISTATAALADAGLVDEDRRAVQPELFWELAGAWQPQWTWLAARPDPEDAPDGRRTWVLTGDRVAASQGAPLVTAGEAPLELFVSDPVSVTLATRRYGSAQPGTGAAAVAVAPTRQVLTGEGHLDGWRTAPVLAVALGLAGDPARGREILRDWPGTGHVWL